MSLLPDTVRAPLRAYCINEAAAGWAELHRTRHLKEIPMSFPARPFIPSPDMSRGNRNLLLLAANLEIADDRHRERGEPTYRQQRLKHRCGTPACALGHSDAIFGAMSETRFSIYGAEYAELFSAAGCGGAKTSREAAAYIKAFAMRRHSEELHNGDLYAAAARELFP